MPASASPLASWRIPVARLRIHQAIVDRLELGADDVLLDLGCGNGFTLATAASRFPGLSVIGVDLDAEAVGAAQSWLGDVGARARWLVADLGAPIPLPDGAVSRVVSHDVLEYLDDPVALLTEACRVMRPGSVSVWSHVDYDTMAIGGADRLLTRRVVAAHSDASYLGLKRTDAQMGRKVAAVVDKSPLTRTAVDASALVATELEGPGRRRVDDIAATVRAAARRGDVDLTVDEVDRWVAELEAADGRHEFFYSHTAFIVTARKAPSDAA